MQTLRLPGNWNLFTIHQKLTYLIDTHQARNYQAAGILLNKQKELIKEKVKQIRLDSAANMRLPYADN